jgi:hypothetical protein
VNDLVSTRSYAELTHLHLLTIRSLALERLENAFRSAPVAATYRDRLELLVLAQGGAQHFLDQNHGLKDIDVWAFFRAGPNRPFPARARWCCDFGPSVHGRHPDDIGFRGRRIDVMGRSIPMTASDDPVSALRVWLQSGRASARALSRRPLVVLSVDCRLKVSRVFHREVSHP